MADCDQVLSYPLKDTSHYNGLMHSHALLDTLQLRQEVHASIYTLLDKYHICPRETDFSLPVRNTIEYITNHLSIQLSVPDIAAETFSAVSTLNRKFKQETGQSIGQYIDNAVLARAEHLLLTTDASIAEISESLGFCDPFYFAKKFKNKFGLPPRIYRKLNINL